MACQKLMVTPPCATACPTGADEPAAVCPAASQLPKAASVLGVLVRAGQAEREGAVRVEVLHLEAERLGVEVDGHGIVAPDEHDLYEAQRSVFLDPNDPEVIAAAEQAGIARDWIDENDMACEDLQVADLNGDGKVDIIAAGRNSHNLKIYWNKN